MLKLSAALFFFVVAIPHLHVRAGRVPTRMRMLGAAAEGAVDDVEEEFVREAQGEDGFPVVACFDDV